MANVPARKRDCSATRTGNSLLCTLDCLQLSYIYLIWQQTEHLYVSRAMVSNTSKSVMQQSLLRQHTCSTAWSIWWYFLQTHRGNCIWCCCWCGCCPNGDGYYTSSWSLCRPPLPQYASTISWWQVAKSRSHTYSYGTVITNLHNKVASCSKYLLVFVSFVICNYLVLLVESVELLP